MMGAEVAHRHGARAGGRGRGGRAGAGRAARPGRAGLRRSRIGLSGSFAGEPASPGLAIGPLVRLSLQRAITPAIAEAVRAAERREARLEAAVGAGAGRAGRRWSPRNDAMGAEILEFQLALLGRPALVEPAFAAIASGASAAAAWQARARRADRRATRAPRTSISAPAPAISPTCAIACSRP